MVGDPSDSIISDYYAFGAHELQHQAGAGRHAHSGHHGQRRAARRGAGAEVRLPARGRHLRLLQRARRQSPPSWRTTTRTSPCRTFAQDLGDTKRRGHAEGARQQLGERLRPEQRPADRPVRERAVRAGHHPDHAAERRTGLRRGRRLRVPVGHAGQLPDAVQPAGRQCQGRPGWSLPVAAERATACSPRSPTSSTWASSSRLDYAGDPAGTQAAVRNIENTVYLPGPSGLANNDDLGAKSSSYLWQMLGLYPENPGDGTLLLNSPGFPHAQITLSNGHDDHRQRARRQTTSTTSIR